MRIFLINFQVSPWLVSWILKSNSCSWDVDQFFHEAGTKIMGKDPPFIPSPNIKKKNLQTPVYDVGCLKHSKKSGP